MSQFAFSEVPCIAHILHIGSVPFRGCTLGLHLFLKQPEFTNPVPPRGTVAMPCAFKAKSTFLHFPKGLDLLNLHFLGA